METVFNNRKFLYLIVVLIAIFFGTIIVRGSSLFLGEIFILLISAYLLLQYPECFLGIFQSGVVGIFMFYSLTFSSLGYWTLIPFVGLAFYALRYRINFSLLINKLSISQLLFAVWLLISLYRSTDLGYGIEKTKYFLSWNLFPLIGCMFFIEDFDRLKRVLYTFAIGVISIGLSGYYLYRAGIFAGPYRLGTFTFSSNPIWFGRIAGLASIFIIGYLFPMRSGEKVKLVLLPVLFFLLFNMILSGTRAALLAFIGATSVFFVLGLLKKGTFSSQILAFILLILLISAVFQYVPEGYTKRYSALISAERIMVEDRIPLMKSAWQTFLDSPIIGKGAGSYSTYGGFKYPHNIFLEIAAELGLVGLAIFCFFVYQVFRHTSKIILDVSHYTDTQRKIIIILICAFVFYLIAAQFSFDITGNAMLWFLGGLAWSIARSYTLAEERV